MKNILPILLFTFIGTVSQARIIDGSQCGLIDFADDFEMQNEKYITLTMNTKLTALQKQQIIVAADLDEAISFKESLAHLIDSSEGGDVYYETGVFNGQAYEVVRYYPGGNPYGTIFKKGQTNPHAYISDSDLTCAQ